MITFVEPITLIMRGLIYILSALILTSCASMAQSTTVNSSNPDNSILSVEIFQTLNKNEALAWNHKYKVEKLVKFDNNGELYYDGKQVTGTFNLTDTYTYITKEGYSKTVPVYSRKNPITATEIGTQTSISARIIQTLSKYEALAITSDHKIIKLETISDVYYDDKEYNETFSLAGTYTYTNREGDVKTVPVYIRTTEYDTLTQQAL